LTKSQNYIASPSSQRWGKNTPVFSCAQTTYTGKDHASLSGKIIKIDTDCCHPRKIAAPARKDLIAYAYPYAGF
jgi:hypothetical protein